MTPAVFAASALRTDNPISAPTQENASANSSSSANPAAAATRPPEKRNPTSAPTTTITSTMHALPTVSATVRPASTADRAIGSDRNRSMMPFCRSSASPTAVTPDANATVWTKIPGIRPGQPLVDGGVLPRQADQPAHLVRVAQHVDPGDLCPAGVRAQQRGEHPHGGGLAGAVRPEDPEHGRRGDREVETGQRAGAAVGLLQPLGADRGAHQWNTSV